MTCETIDFNIVEDGTIQFNVTISTTAAGAGTGDVLGPASSTDNAIARFDGTGGKTLQDSGVILTDGDILKNVAEIWADTTGDTKIVFGASSMQIWVGGVKVQDWG